MEDQILSEFKNNFFASQFSDKYKFEENINNLYETINNYGIETISKELLIKHLNPSKKWLDSFDEDDISIKVICFEFVKSHFEKNYIGYDMQTSVDVNKLKLKSFNKIFDNLNKDEFNHIFKSYLSKEGLFNHHINTTHNFYKKESFIEYPVIDFYRGRTINPKFFLNEWISNIYKKNNHLLDKNELIHVINMIKNDNGLNLFDCIDTILIDHNLSLSQLDINDNQIKQLIDNIFDKIHLSKKLLNDDDEKNYDYFVHDFFHLFTDRIKASSYLSATLLFKFDVFSNKENNFEYYSSKKTNEMNDGNLFDFILDKVEEIKNLSNFENIKNEILKFKSFNNEQSNGLSLNSSNLPYDTKLELFGIPLYLLAMKSKSLDSIMSNKQYNEIVIYLNEKSEEGLMENMLNHLLPSYLFIYDINMIFKFNAEVKFKLNDEDQTEIKPNDKKIINDFFKDKNQRNKLSQSTISEINDRLKLINEMNSFYQKDKIKLVFTIKHDNFKFLLSNQFDCDISKRDDGNNGIIHDAFNFFFKNEQDEIDYINNHLKEFYLLKNSILFYSEDVFMFSSLNLLIDSANYYSSPMNNENNAANERLYSNKIKSFDIHNVKNEDLKLCIFKFLLNMLIENLYKNVDNFDSINKKNLLLLFMHTTLKSSNEKHNIFEFIEKTKSKIKPEIYDVLKNEFSLKNKINKLSINLNAKRKMI